MIWRRDGQELARSSNAPSIIPIPAKSKFAEPQPPRTRGNLREVFHSTPPGEILLTGRSIAPELDELRRTAAWLAIFGSVILLLGLGGGWWSATHAIRPIQDISGTALKIAGGDLSQRINISDTQNELGKLANILNSTFSRLEGSFAEQKQFTSDAAHELRTPVSVMLTQTQTALSRERSAPEYRETLEACQRAAQRMRRLIEALLELARLDAGQESMKRQKFDLSRVAAECVDLIRPLAEQNKLAIECQLPASECEGDPERLGQVITNLLTNAIQYNHEGGKVGVAIEVQSGSVLFSVTNTGPGISAEDLPHLFSRFYRADKSRTTGRTGLGLAISKAIVEAHSGTIEVASEPGQGATFTVRLPA
jgi:heavy metal sensor kinase